MMCGTVMNFCDGHAYYFKINTRDQQSHVGHDEHGRAQEPGYYLELGGPPAGALGVSRHGLPDLSSFEQAAAFGRQSPFGLRRQRASLPSPPC